jgi:hypothetical protein
MRRSASLQRLPTLYAYIVPGMYPGYMYLHGYHDVVIPVPVPAHAYNLCIPGYWVLVRFRYPKRRPHVTGSIVLVSPMCILVQVQCTCSDTKYFGTPVEVQL